MEVAVNRKDPPLLSRREFAKRAAALSATAGIVPRDVLLKAANGPQEGTNTNQLSTESQLEAESRYQQVLKLYGEHLDEAQKAHVKKMCADLQPTLEKVRNYKLENGSAPALYLKPLVEREKK